MTPRAELGPVDRLSQTESLVIRTSDSMFQTFQQKEPAAQGGSC